MRVAVAAGVAGSLGLARAAGAQVPVPSAAAVAANALVVALRPLDFAAVLPGMAKFVDAVSPHGGVLEVRGDPTRQVRIALTLPTVILTTGGVFLPVNYGTSDAILSTAFDPTLGIRIDPNVPRLACLNPSTGSLFLFLGGTALPRATQRRGQYAGTVVATVTYTGAPCP